MESGPKQEAIWGFPKTRGTLFGVPIISRSITFRVPLFWETTIYGAHPEGKKHHFVGHLRDNVNEALSLGFRLGAAPTQQCLQSTSIYLSVGLNLFVFPPIIQPLLSGAVSWVYDVLSVRTLLQHCQCCRQPLT